MGLDSDLRRCLVHEIDCLVRQVPAGHVPLRQPHRCAERIVRDFHTVVLFIARPEALKHLDRIVDRWLVDIYRREAALKRRVRFDMLAVLVQRSGAHRLQLAPCKRRLHHAAGVYGPLRGARPHYRVELVNEEDDLTLRSLHFVQNRLEPLLELSPHGRSGYEGAHLQ